jgi:TatD DNase family protein
MLINLHTHRRPRSVDEFVIRNAFGIKLNKQPPLPYSLSTGIHPWLVKKDNSEVFKIIEENLHCQNVIALGECGLDRVRGPEFQLQTEVFLRHVELANHFKKPLILHLVKTYSDVLSHAIEIKTPWIIHGFKGNLIEANNLINKGASLSFGPRLLTQTEIQDVFKQIPLNKIYLETDTKPILINQIYQFAADLVEKPVLELENLIQENFERDFSVVLPKL